MSRRAKRKINKAIRLTNYNKREGLYLAIRSKKTPGMVYYLRPRFFFFLTACLAAITAFGIFTYHWLNPKQEPIKQASYIPTENIMEPIVNQSIQEPLNTQTFTATYYCGCSKCCGKYSDGYEEIAYGAKGTLLTPYYSIAVDPKVIPLGTILSDDLGNQYEAVDTGKAIKGNKVDIFTGNHQEALNLGKKEIILNW